MNDENIRELDYLILKSLLNYKKFENHKDTLMNLSQINGSLTSVGYKSQVNNIPKYLAHLKLKKLLYRRKIKEIGAKKKEKDTIYHGIKSDLTTFKRLYFIFYENKEIYLFLDSDYARNFDGNRYLQQEFFKASGFDFTIVAQELNRSILDFGSEPFYYFLKDTPLFINKMNELNSLFDKLKLTSLEKEKLIIFYFKMQQFFKINDKNALKRVKSDLEHSIKLLTLTSLSFHDEEKPSYDDWVKKIDEEIKNKKIGGKKE